MFVDEISIRAHAGRGGDGVVRWRREKFEAKGGPSGGDGGKGGDVYVRAVRDIGLLARYTGAKEFRAADGAPGGTQHKSGKNGADLFVDVPIGSTVTERERGRMCVLTREGETHLMLKGGRGGYGNAHFKSPTNRAPAKATRGMPGESGTLDIVLSLVVDVGIVGLPNAGKSSLLNALTNASSPVGAYPFTTLVPYLGDCYGVILADIPGLIEGASRGRGLGHKFLRHIARTKMLLHCISLDEETDAKSRYAIVRNELGAYDKTLLTKEEWIVLTKTDAVSVARREESRAQFASLGLSIYTVSSRTGEGIEELRDALVRHVRNAKE